VTVRLPPLGELRTCGALATARLPIAACADGHDRFTCPWPLFRALVLSVLRQHAATRAGRGLCIEPALEVRLPPSSAARIICWGYACIPPAIVRASAH
jgi:hypothetical protein